MADMLLPVVTRLTECLTVNPAGLQQVQSELEAAHRQMGGAAFSSAACQMLVAQTGLPAEVRQTAGMVLKQHIMADPSSFTPELLAVLLQGLAEKQPEQVAKAVCAICAGLAGTHAAPLMDALLALPRNQGTWTLYCISQLASKCVDTAAAGFNAEFCGRFAGLVPELLETLPHATEQKHLVSLLKNLFGIQDDDMRHVFAAHSEKFLAVLLSAVQDKELVLGCLPETIDLWQYCSPQAQEEIARLAFEVASAGFATGADEHRLKACHFYFEIAHHELPCVAAYIPKMLPQLVSALAWTDEAIEDAGLTNGDNADVVEKEETTHVAVNRDGGDGEGSDEETAGDRAIESSNLRAEATYAIGQIAQGYGETAAVVLEYLRANACDDRQRWREREAVVTMLGAVVEDCLEVFNELGATGALIGSLVSFVTDEPHALVRDAALYCIAQLTAAAVDEDGVAPPAWAKDVCMPLLVKHMEDRNKSCQKTCLKGLRDVASRGFCTFELCEAVSRLAVGNSFQLQNRCVAFQVAGEMVRRLGKSGVQNVKIAELFHSYTNTFLQSQGYALVLRPELPSVLFCTAEAMKLCPADSALGAVQGSISLCNMVVAAAVEAAKVHPEEELGFDSVTMALDMVSALHDSFPEAFSKTASSVREIVRLSMTLLRPGQQEDCSISRFEMMLHSVGSLIGDICSSDFGAIADVSQEIARYLMQFLTDDVLRVETEEGVQAKSQLAWALGEMLAVAPDAQAAEIVGSGPLRSALATALLEDAALSFRQNVAVLFGRVAYRGGTVLMGAPHEPELVARWCLVVATLDAAEAETTQAMTGMLRNALELPKSDAAAAVWVLLCGVVAVGEWSLPAQLRAGLLERARDEAALAAALGAMPAGMKTGVLFRYVCAARGRSQRWSLGEVNFVAGTVGAPQSTEAQWKALCKVLGASPKMGLDADEVEGAFTMEGSPLNIDQCLRKLVQSVQ
eukprot:Rhum_TRINITY_DN9004_c0_g1::Rhum_TRINITY_DN9004_c0_g1_i1::g.31097::m.31097/K18752/TNPO1, IPO2, KPNB2; transportin-1